MSSAEGDENQRQRQAPAESSEESERAELAASGYRSDDDEESKCLGSKDKVVVRSRSANPGDPQLGSRLARQAARSCHVCARVGNKQEPQANAHQPRDSEKEGGGESVRRKRSLYAIDCLIAAVIVGPLVAAHWKGIWVWMDRHEDIFSGWHCFGLGASLHLVFALARQPLHDKFSGRGSVCLRVARTLYIYLFSLSCNLHWRGVWIILEQWFGLEAGMIACFTGAVLGDVLLLRCTRNLLAPPFLVSLDSSHLVFRFPTMYRLNSRDWALYVLDCAFSVGVVGTLVVFVWRGAWALLDLYLFPESREHSAIGSLVLGYALVALTFSLQPLVRRGCARLQGLRRLLLADLFLLLTFSGTVNLWRGIWNSLDLFLLPSRPQTSCWISHLGCFLLLVLLNCSNSVLVRGVYIDGEEPGGRCVVFPCHYLRILFKESRQRKDARRTNLIVAAPRDLAAAEASSKEAENGALLVDAATPIVTPSRRPPEALV